MFQLYQFKFSHYCEKVRWALDHKGIPYAPRNLLPGFHLRVTRKLAPLTCLPILVADGVVVQDSTDIISFLEQKFPANPLSPKDPNDANEALEWEEYLDAEIGVALRLWFYFYALPDRTLALQFLSEGASWHQRSLFALAFPPIRSAMTKMMDVHAESADASEARVVRALERLDNALTRRPFLVIDRFSRADLTACALLAPLCRPGEPDAQVQLSLPAHVNAFRNEHKDRPIFRWVREMYGHYRRPVRPDSLSQQHQISNRHVTGAVLSGQSRSPCPSMRRLP